MTETHNHPKTPDISTAHAPDGDPSPLTTRQTVLKPSETQTVKLDGLVNILDIFAPSGGSTTLRTVHDSRIDNHAELTLFCVPPGGELPVGVDLHHIPAHMTGHLWFWTDGKID